MADYINKIRTTEGDKPVNYEALANKPNSLPNPNKIKFTGSVVAEYDGSSEVTVNIPNGASEEQAAQIQTNTNDISELKNKTSELKGDLTGVDAISDFVQGSISGGVDVDATNRIRSGFYELKHNEITVFIPREFQTLVHYYDENKAYVDRSSAYATGEVVISKNNYSYIKLLIRNSSNTNIVPSDLSTVSVSFSTLLTDGLKDYIRYVSASGSDNNSGKNSVSPFATIQKAIDDGGTIIYVADGTYKKGFVAENIDKLSIIGKHFILDNTEELLVSASESLLKASKVFSNASNWYSVFVAKTKTPQRTGTQSLTYNAILWEVGTEHYKMIPVLSLTECQNTVGSFFYDGSNIYIHPKQANAKYKYLINEEINMVSFVNVSDLTVIGMEIKYSDNHTVKIENVKKSKFENCKASYSAFGGGFRTLNANTNFINCEAFGMCSDGFGLSSGGHTTFYDCYAHDNGDDGVSHHNGCTGSVFGGEYSGNGKGGITPAYGAEVNIYNAICHHNRYGIYYTGNVDNKTDKVMNMSCCVMYDNTDKDLRAEYSKVRSFASKYATEMIDSTATVTVL